MPDPHRIETLEQLREHYRHPNALVVGKERDRLDEATQGFLSRCRFAMVGTFDADGNPDVSPRGGPSGFVRVLDETHIALADLNGNNRLDTLQNVVLTGRIGFVFVVPGQSETVRVNGAAWVSTDPALLAGFGLPRTPVSALVCEVQTTFIHCAKAFRRGGVWDPEVWADLADAPDGAAILSCQAVVDLAPEQIRTMMAEGYEHDLAEDVTPST
jgi:uncharacterized protein